MVATEVRSVPETPDPSLGGGAAGYGLWIEAKLT